MEGWGSASVASGVCLHPPPTYVSPSRLSGVILPVTSSLCNDSRKDERCVYLEMTWRLTPSESLLLRPRVSRFIVIVSTSPSDWRKC